MITGEARRVEDPLRAGDLEESRTGIFNMLRSLSATRSLILNVSTCIIVCRRHDDPTNGPMGDPGMVRLP